MLRSGFGRSGDTARAHARREDRPRPTAVGANPLVQQDDRPGVPGSGGSASIMTGNGSRSNWGTGRQSSAPVVPEHAAQHDPLTPTNDPVPSGNRRDPGTGVALCGPCSCSTRSQWPSSSLRARRKAVPRVLTWTLPRISERDRHTSAGLKRIVPLVGTDAELR